VTPFREAVRDEFGSGRFALQKGRNTLPRRLGGAASQLAARPPAVAGRAIDDTWEMPPSG